MRARSLARLTIKILNIFSILKPSKHHATISPSCISNSGCPTPQSISPLCICKMGCQLFLFLSSFSQLLSILQFLLLSESLLLVYIFHMLYLIYEIYLTPESLAHCHLRLFRQIINLSIRLNKWNAFVYMLSM